MINNIQDLFLKYKSKISSKNEIENKIIDLIKKEVNLEIKKENIKINQKDKNISIINLGSSSKFILKNKFLEKDLENKVNKDLNYKIFI
ncbi:MAG: hypothetical protein U0469_02610 [Candidatus Paceibacterota bacterium]|jgi:hypothetical protein